MNFLKNVWYVAGRAAEVETGMLARKICNQPILFFRKGDGSIAALEDRCPHRFVPLSMGRREGDAVRCGYHGLLFDAGGSCIERPAEGEDGNRTPIGVRTFPAIDRYAHIWVWLGDPALADPDLIPDFGFLSDPDFAVVTGYLNVKANYELVADNLLDLSHVVFLHPEIAPTGNINEWDTDVVQKGDTVWQMLARPAHVPNAFQKMLWGSPSDVADGRANVRWNAPSVLYADTAIAECGEDIETTGCKFPSAHLLTPETDRTTHYFWNAGRNAMVDDAQLSAGMQAAVERVFTTQDGPMIEAEQAMMGAETDLVACHPVILKADAPSIRARRILAKLIRQEAAVREPA